MANILVTGGAGYVGSVCSSRLLELGHNVVVVDNLSTGHISAVPQGATFHKLDIGDRIELNKVMAANSFDAVFHFAAKALIPESISNPGLFFESNVASGVALLECARATGISRFVFSSSAAVYGRAGDSPIDEDHDKSPVNAYGETKLMLERALQWYASAYNWTVIAFRYFNASGATRTIGEDHQPETHIIPLLLQAAMGEREEFEIYGSDYPTADGTCHRDFVHVLDIADAHVLALNRPKHSGFFAYNIGTGKCYSVRQVCTIVEEETGCQIAVRVGPRRPGDPAILCASPKRLMGDLEWRPVSSDLREIIRSAWRWKQSHRSGYVATSDNGNRVYRSLLQAK